MRGNYNDSSEVSKKETEGPCTNCGGTGFVAPSGTYWQFVEGTTPQIPCPVCNG